MSSKSTRTDFCLRLKKLGGDYVRIDDLAELLQKSRHEVEEMLKSSDVVELNLSERHKRERDLEYGYVKSI